VVPDLNNPPRAEYENITTRSKIQALATGIADGDRDAYGPQVTFSEILARDLYRIDVAEPRYVSNLLGTAIGNSNFIGNSTWTIPYSTILEARSFANAIDTANVTIDPVTDAEKAAVRGFALTMAGLQYIRVIETRDVRGAAIQGDDDSAPAAPISCKPAVLAYTSLLLDTAATALRAGGPAAFPFALPSGFTGFTTSDAASGTDFLQFNRGLKAKVEMYRGFSPLQTAGSSTAAPDAAALTAALTAIDQSFVNATGTRAALDVGVYHAFSTASGENVNPLVDQGVFRVNPKVITDSINGNAERGDLRIAAKVDTSSSNTRLSSGTGATRISSNYLIRYPSGPTDRLAVMKNGELVLNRALILWGLNRDAEALQMVNVVRQAAGLLPTTFANHQALLRGILKEKRYELLFESPARYVDYRMLGILNELGRERGNNPITNFPIPLNEVTARSGAITCQ
jgi:hypothetical protein